MILKGETEAAAADHSVALDDEVRRTVAHRVLPDERNRQAQARARAERAVDFGLLGGEDHVARVANRIGQGLVLVRIGLRLGEKHVESDDLRSGALELADELGVESARPRPGKIQLVEGILIDVDDDDRELMRGGTADLKSKIETFILQDVQQTAVMRDEDEARQAGADDELTNA